MPAAQADPQAVGMRGIRRYAAQEDAVAVQPHNGQGRDHGERDAKAPASPSDDLETRTARSGDGHVAPLDDGGLLAADRLECVAQAIHVVPVDVRDRRHAAIPRVRGIEAPAEADLDESQVHALVREPQEGDGGEELELADLAMAAGHPIRGGQDLLHEPGEGRGIDQALPDREPLPVRHEMGLGRAPDPVARRVEGRTRQGKHAALAVRAGHQRTPEGALGMAQLAEQAADPREAELDPEAPAALDRGERLAVGQRASAPARRRARARPRKRRTG